MPHGHGVDNCSIRYCRKGRPLDLGEGRLPTQIVQGNMLPAFHGLRVYVCTFGPGLMVGMVTMAMLIMAMVMMAMVMVLVIVIIVPEELRQVGWLRQC